MTDPRTLAELTTLRVGGPADRVVVADDERTLVDAVREADAGGRPALVVAGGSNLVVGDDGWPGTVVVVRTRGVAVEADTCGGAWVTVAAGEPWDDLVAHAVEQEWAGVEALSGIPGSTGATPVQNVGAYGQEVASTVARVRTLDRTTGLQRTFAASDCGFGYRTSRFKAEAGRFLVLDVSFQLRLSPTSEPVRYAELARGLGVEVGGRAPLSAVREAVLDLRRGKGMVLDAVDHDTWSVGSFFTNPVLDPAAADRLPSDAPRFAQADGRVKTSAAWLIEHAGVRRGEALGGAAVSTKHSLALTNRGSATAADVVALAGSVRDRVLSAYGVLLEPEPTLVGGALAPPSL
ncbi:MAG TPA: UDP-N-acetylmuramate dehydrogenase [Candidatus Nanopelagicales bacterium]|nr:UDP-N-acetylmuramate dehydrogenase [Candidatus Nanopelagicales bacterium]